MELRKIIKISILSLVITVFSFIKMPGIIPGTEFQLSAPVAVSICSLFGFKIYILSGIVSSITTLFLGTHTILNVINAFIFRIVVGAFLYLFGKNILTISISGPIGSIISRVFLSFMTKSSLYPLLISAFPGMVYTFFTAYLITKLFEKILKKGGVSFE